MLLAERKPINHHGIAVGFTQLIMPQLKSAQKLSESIFMVRRYAALGEMPHLDGTSMPVQADRA